MEKYRSLILPANPADPGLICFLFLSFFPLFLPCRLSLYSASFPPRPRPRPPQHHRHRRYPRIIIIDIILGRKLSDECPLQIFSFIVPFCSQNYLSMLRFLSVFSLNRSRAEQYDSFLRKIRYFFCSSDFRSSTEGNGLFLGRTVGGTSMKQLFIFQSD